MHSGHKFAPWVQSALFQDIKIVLFKLLWYSFYMLGLIFRLEMKSSLKQLSGFLCLLFTLHFYTRDTQKQPKGSILHIVFYGINRFASGKLSHTVKNLFLLEDMLPLFAFNVEREHYNQSSLACLKRFMTVTYSPLTKRQAQSMSHHEKMLIFWVLRQLDVWVPMKNNVKQPFKFCKVPKS